MTKGTLHKIFDLVIAIPLIIVGGGYVAADAYGLIESHLPGQPGLIVKEGIGFVFGIPLFLCGVWLVFRPCTGSGPVAVIPSTGRADQSGNLN